jgi:hypothetical protein
VYLKYLFSGLTNIQKNVKDAHCPHLYKFVRFLLSKLAITNDKIMVKWLLEYGASLAEINKAGKTPGDLCTNEQVLKMLKKPL